MLSDFGGLICSTEDDSKWYQGYYLSSSRHSLWWYLFFPVFYWSDSLALLHYLELFKSWFLEISFLLDLYLYCKTLIWVISCLKCKQNLFPAILCCKENTGTKIRLESIGYSNLLSIPDIVNFSTDKSYSNIPMTSYELPDGQ